MIDIDTAVDAFGSQTKLAAALGLGVTTVHGWVKRGAVPRWHQAKVDAAYAARIAALTSSPQRNNPVAPPAAGVADVAPAALSGED